MEFPRFTVKRGGFGSEIDIMFEPDILGFSKMREIVLMGITQLFVGTSLTNSMIHAIEKHVYWELSNLIQCGHLKKTFRGFDYWIYDEPKVR